MLVAGETGSQEEIKGIVSRIVDGDTFFVRSGKSLISVRLSGIDAPERGQPFASQAHDALKEFLGRKDLVIHKSGVDPKDKKVLVNVKINGTNVNSEMVKKVKTNSYTTAAAPAPMLAPKIKEAPAPVEEAAEGEAAAAETPAE